MEYTVKRNQASGKVVLLGSGSMLSLKTIKKHEPKMKRLKVSEVARSPRGFLTAYKKAGNEKKLNDNWKRKREAFIARHNAQYKKNPTKRRRLALIAWAYDPERK